MPTLPCRPERGAGTGKVLPPNLCPLFVPCFPQGEEWKFNWGLCLGKRSWTSPELNHYYAAFVIAPDITACHPHSLPDPVPIGVSNIAALVRAQEKISPGGLESPTLDHPLLLPSFLAECPLPSHFFIFCIWVSLCC